MRAWKFALVGVFACGSRGAERPTPTVPLRHEAPLAESADPAPPDPPAPDDMPPPLEPPRRVACELHTDALVRDRVHELRLRPGAEAVMVVHGKLAATLWLAAGSRFEGALLEARGAEATVRGWLNGPDVDLRLATPRLLAGFIIPSSQTAVSWIGPGQDAVRVGVALQDPIVPAAAIEDDVPCDGLSIGEVDYRARDALPPILYWGELAPGSIALARDRGGASVATLHVQADGPHNVSVHEVQGPEARVAFHAADAIAVGWLPLAKVKRLPDEPLVLGTGHGAGFGSSSGGGHYVALRCPHDLPVMIEKNGDRATVGAIHAGTVFEAAVGDTPVRNVRLHLGWLHTRGFDELQTTARRLEGCSAVSAGE